MSKPLKEWQAMLLNEEIPRHVPTGDAACAHYEGVDHLHRAECCGGREAVWAAIRCSVNGIVIVGKKPCDRMLCKQHRKKQ